MQRSEQASRVPRRPEQVSGLDQPREFTSRNESNIPRPSAPNDDSFLLIHDLIQNAGQVLTQSCICGFSCHLQPVSIVQDFCTPAQTLTAVASRLGDLVVPNLDGGHRAGEKQVPSGPSRWVHENTEAAIQPRSSRRQVARWRPATRQMTVSLWTHAAFAPLARGHFYFALTAPLASLRLLGLHGRLPA